MKHSHILPLILLLLILSSCTNQNTLPSAKVISELSLKQGNVISCGPPNAQFGTVDFDMSCDASAKENFNLAIELLHSFEYDEAEKVFAKVMINHPVVPWLIGVLLCAIFTRYGHRRQKLSYKKALKQLPLLKA